MSLIHVSQEHYEAVAKTVKRTIQVQKKDGSGKEAKPVFDKTTKVPVMEAKEVACKTDDIFLAKFDPNSLQVAVVTTDGQKIYGTVDEELAKTLNPAAE